MCMYIYPYVSPQHICICISEFVFVPHMQNCSDMYHAVCTQYLFTVVINKVQMCSSQFNLTRMFLNSLVACFLGLMILFHLLVNCLRVVWIDCLYVCRVCFDCASHQWCTAGIYCASAAYEWPFFQRKKGFFSFFFEKKMAWRQAWREADVRRQTSALPHLTVWRQARQLIGDPSLFNVIRSVVVLVRMLSIVEVARSSTFCCLLWINKARAKEKTHIWVSVWWKTNCFVSTVSTKSIENPKFESPTILLFLVRVRGPQNYFLWEWQDVRFFFHLFFVPSVVKEVEGRGRRKRNFYNEGQVVEEGDTRWQGTDTTSCFDTR